MDVFVGGLADGGAAVLFFNRGTQPANGTLSLSELPGWSASTQAATVKDVWAQAALPKAVVAGVLHSGEVSGHGVSFLRVAKAK